MNQRGVAKIALILGVAAVVLIIVGVVVKVVVFNPDTLAMKLYEQSGTLATEADSAYLKGDQTNAKEKYDDALAKAQKVLDQYKLTLSAEEAALLAQKCKRRLASLESPKGAVESMIKAVSVPDSDEYLDYWDFQSLAQDVLGEDWSSLDQPQRDRMAKFCHDGTKRLVDQARDLISLVKVSYLEEQIDGDRALVKTKWSAMDQESEVPFKTRNVANLWKVSDFEVSVMGGGPASFLKEALGRCTKDKSVDAFVDAPDFEKTLEDAYVALLEEKQKSIQGGDEGKKASKVLSKDTEVQLDGQVVGKLPAGSVVEVINEAGAGAMTLISSQGGGGAPLVGLVPTENLTSSAPK